MADRGRIVVKKIAIIHFDMNNRYIGVNKVCEESVLLWGKGTSRCEPLWPSSWLWRGVKVAALREIIAEMFGEIKKICNFALVK